MSSNLRNVGMATCTRANVNSLIIKSVAAITQLFYATDTEEIFCFNGAENKYVFGGNGLIIRSVNINDNVAITDEIIEVTSDAGNVTLTLFDGTLKYNATSKRGGQVIVRRPGTDTSGNTVTLSAIAGQQIEGSVSQNIAVGTTIKVVFNGSNWIMV